MAYQLGHHGKQIGKANFEKIRKYFEDNQDASQRQASKALGIGYATIQKHVKKLREGSE